MGKSHSLKRFYFSQNYILHHFKVFVSTFTWSFTKCQAHTWQINANHKANCTPPSANPMWICIICFHAFNRGQLLYKFPQQVRLYLFTFSSSHLFTTISGKIAPQTVICQHNYYNSNAKRSYLGLRTWAILAGALPRV